MKLANMSLTDYIKKAEDTSSVPGGGSIAALCGALAASLAAMVLNLSKAEDKATAYGKFSEILQKNIDEDSTSFDDVLKAFRMAKTTEEEKKIRNLAIEEGYKRAIDVPLSTMEAVLGVIETLKAQEEFIGDEALSDLTMAADLALTAFNGAKDTAMLNVAALKDEATKGVYREKIQAMTEVMVEVHGEVRAFHRA